MSPEFNKNAAAVLILICACYIGVVIPSEAFAISVVILILLGIHSIAGDMASGGFRMMAVILIVLGVYSIVTGDVFQILSYGKWGASRSPVNLGVIYIAFAVVTYCVAIVKDVLK